MLPERNTNKVGQYCTIQTTVDNHDINLKILPIDKEGGLKLAPVKSCKGLRSPRIDSKESIHS